jgi:hypothetical protein
MTARVVPDPIPGSTDLDRLLAQAPSFQHLGPEERRSMAESMARVVQFLSAPAEGGRHAPLAGQLAPDLRERLAPPGAGSSSPSPIPGMSSPSAPPAAAPATSGGPAPSGGGGAVGRAGEVARATLSAIDFPQFVAALIQGTFQAIVDSSIQQMEAYAKLLQSAATTVDRFMDDQISDGQARDYLAEQHGGFFTRDTSGAFPVLRVRQDRRGGELPSFLRDLGFDTPQDIDDDAVEQVVVPATRRRIAEERQQTLATMVLMGINRVVIDDGEITAKLMFHIDATDQTRLKFDQTKTTAGTMAGRSGTSPFSAQSLMVNTINLNTQSDVNVRADLTGQVRVKFRSETFPLERFADSAAIQLINTRAKVPETAGARGPNDAQPVAGVAAPTAAPAQPPAPAPPPVTATIPVAREPEAPPARTSAIPSARSARNGDASIDPWA